MFTRRTGPLTWRDDPILAATQTALPADDCRTRSRRAGSGWPPPPAAPERWRHVTAGRAVDRTPGVSRAGRTGRAHEREAFLAEPRRRVDRARRSTPRMAAARSRRPPAAGGRGRRRRRRRPCVPRPFPAGDARRWVPIGPSVVPAADRRRTAHGSAAGSATSPSTAGGLRAYAASADGRRLVHRRRRRRRGRRGRMGRRAARAGGAVQRAGVRLPPGELRRHRRRTTS